MRRFSMCLALGLAFGGVVVAAPAFASVTDTVSGVGIWATSLPAGTKSAPDTVFAFTFDVETPNGVSNIPVVTGSFSLDGSPVDDALDHVSFFADADGGMFNIVFASGDVLSVAGADVGSAGDLLAGSYAVTYELQYADLTPTGMDASAGVVTIAGASFAEPTAMPEPVSMGLLASGLAGLAGVSISRRRSHSALRPA